MRLHEGTNYVDGIPVALTRRATRRIGLRIAQDGTICLSVPRRLATIAEGEKFLSANWQWALAARAKVLAQPAKVQKPVSQEEIEALSATLGELHSAWCARLGETGVTWKTRRMKTLWGSCHYAKRHIVYSTSLARVPRELAEYVVVHELTHLRAHDHGPAFRALMDQRLPDWRTLRRRLRP